MYQAKNRLKKRKQFNYIHAKGVSVQQSEILSIRYAFTNSVCYKIGFSVSKKIGTAVIRNKIKRRLKEAFRSLNIEVPKCFYFVVIAKPQITLATYEEIKSELEKNILKMISYNENK